MVASECRVSSVEMWSVARGSHATRVTCHIMHACGSWSRACHHAYQVAMLQQLYGLLYFRKTACFLRSGKALEHHTKYLNTIRILFEH